jgi:AcrR family transcriptional regulator
MPRGRPRQFDRDTALMRAMDLFWQRGYQDTSIAELTEHLGIGSPSLYAAFGSKSALFCEAADLYQSADGARPGVQMDDAATARDGIERLLRANVDLFTRPAGPRGCLLTRATLSCPAGDATVQSYLEGARQQRLRQIEDRLRRGVEAGERLPAADPRVLAHHYDTLVQGLAVTAMEGTSRKALHETVDFAMSAWDAIDR